jgi:hypothetical protein
LSKDLTTRNEEPDLDELAGHINREHEKVEAALRTGLEHALAAGNLLLLAKKKLVHGRWLPWLKENVAFSERAAQSYMRIADRWDELTAKSAPGADLTYKQALALLAEPAPVPAFDDEKITSLIGQIARALNDRAKAYGRTPAFKDAWDRLDDVNKAWTCWQAEKERKPA